MIACGGSPDDTDGASSGITAWYMTAPPDDEVVRGSFDAWNADHPDKKITYEVYANDAYKEKIRTTIGAGNAPTLVFSFGAEGPVAEYVAAGKVIDLTGKVDKALSRTLDSVDENGVLPADGKTYAVPTYSTQPVILYYNKALFEQAGVEAPIETWDELLASIEKFKAIGVAPIALAGQSKWPDLMWLEYLADRVGGPQTFDDVVAGKPDAWSSPEMIKALEMIQELVAADGFQNAFGSTNADAWADVALMYSGKAAMMLQGVWCYGVFKADSPDFIEAGDLGSFVFPAVTGGKGDKNNIAGNVANYWSVSADATPEQQAAAIEFLNEQSYTDAMIDEYIAGGGLPPVEGIEAKLQASEDADFLVQAYDLVKNAPHFQNSWDQVLSSSASQELLTNLDAIFQGQITPQEFADNMNQTL
jgi:raffinose/stachyose/melibiose transport system substrate-binding protein